MPLELVGDSFAGGGGASEGAKKALKRDPDFAINHDGVALAIHKANHPGSEHFITAIQGLHPHTATRGRPMALLWASPDCCEFSVAKGGAPRRLYKRDLACAVTMWAQIAKPRVIILENVKEFETYGPAGGFLPWVETLRKAGYHVEWRTLVAADYGAPTTRKRLFLIARRDGRPIVWPTPTHGPGRALPWRTAAEIIDWSLPIHSIFMDPQEAKQYGIQRPLKPKTLARIARGVQRFVLDAAKPFIVPVTGANRGEISLVSPFFVERYGERPGQDPRCRTAEAPLSTVVPTGNGAQLVAAFMAQHNRGATGHGVEEPLSTITGRGSQQQIVAGNLLKLRNNCHGSDMQEPVHTLAAQGEHFGVVASHMLKLNQNSTGQDVNDPLHTVMAGATRFGLVASFMAKYYRTATGCDLHDPLHTITGTDRFGLVTVKIGGEEWALYDIAMRMLSARELYNAQGFPRDYIIDPPHPTKNRPICKTEQVEACGNSVCPQVAEALIRANVEVYDVETPEPDFGELFAEVA